MTHGSRLTHCKAVYKALHLNLAFCMKTDTALCTKGPVYTDKCPPDSRLAQDSEGFLGQISSLPKTHN